MALKSEDKIITLVNRLGERIAKVVFLRLPFSQIHLNFLSFVLALAAAFLFSFGSRLANYLGLFVLLASIQVDYADHVVARAKGWSSQLGAWLEPFLELMSKSAIFLGVGWGLLRNYGFKPLIVFITFMGFWALVLGELIMREFNRAFFLDSSLGDTGLKEAFSRLKKKNLWDKFLLNTIIPHQAFFYLLYTFRYFLLLGIFFNRMLAAITLVAIFAWLRNLVTVVIYALFLQKKTRLPIVHALTAVKLN